MIDDAPVLADEGDPLLTTNDLPCVKIVAA
jgi:hypothetical protein